MLYNSAKIARKHCNFHPASMYILQILQQIRILRQFLVERNLVHYLLTANLTASGSSTFQRFS